MRAHLKPDRAREKFKGVTEMNNVLTTKSLKGQCAMKRKLSGQCKTVL